MRVLFISNYFPPEVNAPATRLHEHARLWVRQGQVEVLTAVPNYPEGVIYPGYENRFTREDVEGIKINRVPVYIATNKALVKRSLSYFSFMASAIWHSRKSDRPDVVVASSPQFLSAIAGYIISKLKRRPFVLEIRDLWPESIVAVGAMRRNWVIKLLEKVEHFLYRKAYHIVVVTDSFKRIIAEKGTDARKITVLKNGVDLDDYTPILNHELLDELRRQYGLANKFVASYIGTIGMAHRADILLDAAQRCTDPDVLFVVMGAGAELESIAARQAELKLTNFKLIEKQPKHLVRYFLELSHICVVHLRDSPLFETVIPSKIFEAMIARKPIVLGVRGESCEIVERAGAGIPITPEDSDSLLEAIERLRRDKTLYESLADNGYNYVRHNHDRKALAQQYWVLLEKVVREYRDVHSFTESSELASHTNG
jgi:glycosyltransferase involved in cell wall biosynthesis